MTQKSRTSASNTPRLPAAGKGMPGKEPQPQKPQAGKQPDFNDASVENTLELPSDRDQAVDMTSGQTDPLIRQAAQDIQKGRQDTSKALETHRAYKKL
jgi:hypothetical protein